LSDTPVIHEVTVEGSFTFEQAMAALARKAIEDREAEQGARLRGKHAVHDDEEVDEDGTT
jgi:hypothetical protein